MYGLRTDLYQLTMAAGYFEAGKTRERATFELFVRRLPERRDFLIAAGLEQAVEYLLNVSFTPEEIDYVRSLPQFAAVSPAFFEYLKGFRFTGDLFAMPEGTPFLAGEPIFTIRAPLIEAQIVETFVLSTVSFQSMIASKAVRVVAAAGNANVVEFGSRRAHSPEAGVLGARAAFIGGCIGTSNVEAGFRFGVPIYGTAAHSWTTAFAGELASFRHLQRLLGSGTVYLVDSYDTLEGTRRAASLGAPLWGVRLDSGNFNTLSREVRSILDNAGLRQAKIMASGDLNEDSIRELISSGAPIDSFGVGTELATSADAPNLSAVYKMVEIEIEGIKRYTAKYSLQKQTMPGAKQVFRYVAEDRIGCCWECHAGETGGSMPEALLRPVILDGRRVERLPSAAEARERCRRSIGAMQPGRPLVYTEHLLDLARRHKEGSPA